MAHQPRKIPDHLKVAVVMPLRDDWASARELIGKLQKGIGSDFPCALYTLLVDDASDEQCNPEQFAIVEPMIRQIRVLRLRRNLGHQRAIAVGLSFLEQEGGFDAVLVMDADGEDTPEGVVQLLKVFRETSGKEVIFAARQRRSESLVFQWFYWWYKAIHKALTGISVRVGNFSILPFDFLHTLVVCPEMWNHYAAAVFRSKLPFTMVPIDRGERIAGRSQMNFVGLVTHGLSAMSVFGDIVGVRLLIAALLGSVIAGLGVISVASIRFFTPLAIPGWATSAIGALAIVMIQFLTIAAAFSFLVLSNRTNFGFIPLRDYSLFIAEITEITGKTD